MAEFDGAKPFPGAPKRPGAYPTPATRPFRRDADGCFPVAMDNMIVPTLYANENNNNQDSYKQPRVTGGPQSGKGGGNGTAQLNPDAHVNTPQGKPSV